MTKTEIFADLSFKFWLIDGIHKSMVYTVDQIKPVNEAEKKLVKCIKELNSACCEASSALRMVETQHTKENI